jgi:hypothetical protein
VHSRVCSIHQKVALIRAQFTTCEAVVAMTALQDLIQELFVAPREILAAVDFSNDIGNRYILFLEIAAPYALCLPQAGLQELADGFCTNRPVKKACSATVVGTTKDNKLKTGKHVLDKAKPYWDLIAIACFKQTSNEAGISEVAVEADTQYVGKRRLNGSGIHHQQGLPG